MIKTCPHCASDNFENAKYCIGCEKPLAGVVAGVRSVAKPKNQAIQFQIESDIGGELEPEAEGLASSLTGAILNMFDSKPRGVKLKDALGTGGKVERDAPKDRRSGKTILASEGANDPSLVARFKGAGNISDE